MASQDVANKRAGSSSETNGFGQNEQPQRPGGLYRLKNKDGEVVDEQIIKTHPLFGDGQAAAFERVGYEYVREAKPGEVKELEITPNPGLSGDAKEDLKGLQARMSKYEDETKAKDDEISSLRAQLAQRDGDNAEVQLGNNEQVQAQQSAATKEEAVARTNVRLSNPLEEGTTAETDRVLELKAKAQQNASEAKSDSSSDKQAGTGSDSTQSQSGDASTGKAQGSAAKGTTTTPTANTNDNAKKASK